MTTKIAEALLGQVKAGNETLRFLAEAGYLWFFRGQLDKAIVIFEALVALIPGDPVAHLGLAQIYLSIMKFREAEKEAQLAARSARGDRRTTALAYKLQGRALIQMNRLRDAEKALERAAQIDLGGPEGVSALKFIEAVRQMGIFPPAAPQPVH